MKLVLITKQLWCTSNGCACLQVRAERFSRWLRSRPEEIIVAYGHFVFWLIFTRGSANLQNA